MSTGSIRFLAVAVLFPLLAGCPRVTAIWIEEGSTAEKLVFRVAEARESEDPIWIHLLDVVRFDPASTSYETVWGFVYESLAAPEVTRLEFGVLPNGAQLLRGVPEEVPVLVPGCYKVYTGGTGRTTFFIEEDGGVREVADESCQDT